MASNLAARKAVVVRPKGLGPKGAEEVLWAGESAW